MDRPDLDQIEAQLEAMEAGPSVPAAEERWDHESVMHARTLLDYARSLESALAALAGIDPMTVRDIVRQYLATSGLDGLYNRDGECACLVADLAPCGEIRESCEAGKRVSCDGTLDGCPCGFHVVSAIGVDLTEIPTPCCPLTPDEETRP